MNFIRYDICNSTQLPKEYKYKNWTWIEWKIGIDYLCLNLEGYLELMTES